MSLRFIAGILAIAIASSALAQAPPPIPTIPDATRGITYNITSSTSQVQVPFAVFGDCSDINVQINGVTIALPTALWSCASASGTALASLPLPITDMVVNFTPALTTGTTTITGAWHPRNLTVPTGAGINRREYEQAISTLIAAQRELYSGMQSVGAISLTPLFASPPAIGNVTPNIGFFSALTFSANTKYSQPVLNASGLTFFSPIFDVMAAGAVGDGVADDTTAIQAAATAAAAAGGKLRFPCGTFKLTTAITVTVGSGKNFAVVGGGTECTIINATGAIGGFVFNYNNQYSSVTASDFTLTTNQAGVQIGLNFVQPAAISFPAYVPPNLVQNVSLRGNGGYQDATNYWGTGVNLSNVSNTNVINYFFSGKFAGVSGAGIKIIGLPGSSTYAVVLNVIGSTFNNCSSGLTYGSFVQGVTVNQSNFTGCGVGIQTPVSQTGILAQLDVTNSQFGNNSIGAISLGTNVAGVGISNNLFIFPANTTCILLGGTEWQVSGNQFNSGSTTTNFAVVVIAGAGSVASSRGVIQGNAFYNMFTAIYVDVGATANIGMNSYYVVTTRITDASTVIGAVMQADFSAANNSLLIKPHLGGNGTAPAITACGTTPTISTGANDMHGTVTEGTATPAGCVLTFSLAYANPPDCTVTWRTQLPAAFTYVTSTTALTVTQTAANSQKFTYTCMGQ